MGHETDSICAFSALGVEKHFLSIKCEILSKGLRAERLQSSTDARIMSKENWVAAAETFFFVNNFAYALVQSTLTLPYNYNMVFVYARRGLNKIIQDTLVYNEIYLSKNLCISTESL